MVHFQNRVHCTEKKITLDMTANYTIFLANTHILCILNHLVIEVQFETNFIKTNGKTMVRTGIWRQRDLSW